MQPSCAPPASPSPRQHSLQSAGFSLIIVSVLITVAAILLVALLPGGGAGDYNAKTISNVEKLEKVEDAAPHFICPEWAGRVLICVAAPTPPEPAPTLP